MQEETEALSGFRPLHQGLLLRPALNKETPMKRYLLFAGRMYYPGGGWSDYHGSFDTIAEAMEGLKACEEDRHDWAHVVDKTDGTYAWRQ